MPSLFSILVREKDHVLRYGKLLLPNVVSSQIKQIKADEEYSISRLSRLSTARGSGTSLEAVGPTKVMACKSVYSLKVPLRLK